MLTEPVPTLLSVICRTAWRGGFPTGEVMEGVFEHDRNIGLKSNKKLYQRVTEHEERMQTQRRPAQSRVLTSVFERGKLCCTIY